MGYCEDCQYFEQKFGYRKIDGVRRRYLKAQICTERNFSFDGGTLDPEFWVQCQTDHFGLELLTLEGNDLLWCSRNKWDKKWRY